jgi:hypothetical protein
VELYRILLEEDMLLDHWVLCILWIIILFDWGKQASIICLVLLLYHIDNPARHSTNIPFIHTFKWPAADHTNWYSCATRTVLRVCSYTIGCVTLLRETLCV